MLRFDAQETIESVCRCLWRWMRTHGVPKSVYADGRNMYHITDGGRENFFTAMCRRLGIGTIHAHSPQAKGRVERANGTHQARLVPLLQLDGVKDMDALNAYAAGYEAEHNKRFSCPAPGGDCHRPLPKWAKTINDVCWLKSQRTIDNDWTVKYKNKGFQIQRWGSYPPAKSKVDVIETISGTVSITYRDKTAVSNKVATF